MYIPKNRIKTNLYTRGNEYKNIRTGEEYIGYYWSMYNGTLFTGKNPNMRDIDVYNNLNEVDISATQLIPQQYYPNPTEEDYTNGFFMRYFACKINETSYLELDEDTYTKMKKQDPAYNWIPYRIFRIQWTLVGEARNVAQANLSQIDLVETRIRKKGLKEFIRNDFSKFYKPQSIQSNLTTDGTVYKNSRTGLAYSGSYHIHPDKGPMVGAEHIKEYHDYLVPIS